MSTGLLAVILILAIVVTAIATRHCAEVIIAGSLIAAVLMYGTDALTQWCAILQEVFAANVWIILVCGLFGSLIALLQESKGSIGFSRIVSKYCDNERKTLLTTFILGILIFIDDYLNVLSIGVCMKGVFDKRKIPREALAFMLDATGAPVCVLLPFSTWAVFFAGLFYEQEGILALGYDTGIQAYMQAVPFAFYPIFTVLIVFLFAMGWFPKLGDMKKAFDRAQTTGKVYSDASRKYNHEEYEGYEGEGNIWDFLIPMIVLVALAIITGDMLIAVVVALGVCLVLYVPRGVIKFDDFYSLIVKGFADMLPILVLLVCAFTLGNIMETMGLTTFVIDVARPFLSGRFFPLVTFIMVAILTFCTGSQWGMSAVMVPIVFPLGTAIGANMIYVMAAFISGGAFGSHACFFTDATLMSSQSAGIENMEHTMSQLPYVMVAFALTIVGYFVCGVVA